MLVARIGCGDLDLAGQQRSAAAASWEERKPESLPSQHQQPPASMRLFTQQRFRLQRRPFLSYACKEDIDLGMFIDSRFEFTVSRSFS
ncbi:hypothetical protein Ddc_19214 [Ditylenchus destructor]|nr:hypothetical protein Ddc_19214 [Ditylenchus destructor]